MEQKDVSVWLMARNSVLHPEPRYVVLARYNLYPGKEVAVVRSGGDRSGSGDGAGGGDGSTETHPQPAVPPLDGTRLFSTLLPPRCGP